MTDKEKKTPNKQTVSSGDNYDAKDIYVLEGLDPVRKRPGMYIGSTGPSGLHHLIWEVVDNSIDEAMGGHCDETWIIFHKDNYVTVIDNGRGIPVDYHAQSKKSALETVLTTLHAGGKFGGDSYKVAGGLHGVGISVVCALSRWTKATVKKNGQVYSQEYGRGKVLTKLQELGDTKGFSLEETIRGQFGDGKKLFFNKKLEKLVTKFDKGTTISFVPDEKIFTEVEFGWTKIVDHIRQQAYLTKGMKINLVDCRNEEDRCDVYGFYFEGGIKSYVKYLNRSEKVIHKNVFYCQKEYEGLLVEASLQYTEDIQAKEISFANNIHTEEGGMHQTGFRSALTRVINDFGRKNDIIKKDDTNLTGDDIREGLTSIVSIKLGEPQFEGQTKAKLGNPEARTAVEKIVGEAFYEYLEENPQDSKLIIGRSLLAQKAREAAKKAKETVIRKGILEGLSLPGKLADCSSRDPAKTELFIVEGDSAGGCFSGETKVALVDGRNISFKELTKEDKQGKKNFCYTIQSDGHVGIAPIASPRITKKNVKVIKIILDNEEELTCTPEHLFMLRDGKYKMAKDLSRNDSLMPLYRKYSKIEKRITIKDYEMVLDSKLKKGKEYWAFTHVLADEHNLRNNVYSKQKGTHRHHIDFNKRNNSPENIRQMSRDDHMSLHREHASITIHRPEVKEKLAKMRQTQEYREKIRAKMTTPEMRKMLSKRAKKQWEDEGYKKYMAQKFMDYYNNSSDYREQNRILLNKSQKEYWSQEKNREKQAQRVKEYFDLHPKKKEELSLLAKHQWKNEGLLKWRSEETKKQWTSDFRKKRKQAYNKTYYKNTIEFLKRIYEQYGTLEKYREERIMANNKNLLRLDTFCERFFNGEEASALEAVKNYNHKIKRIVNLSKKMDVYDLEVENTHNFALASGVFVHNSAKQGRDRKTQAILPLRGKILNVEKARLHRILASKEIKALIIAMGTAIAEEFSLEKLRYHKIVIMTDADVDGAHIATLLLTLFYRYFKPIIDAGHLYIANPPLFRIKVGSKHEYVYSEEEKDKILKKHEERGVTKIDIQRYKGLGEMNPEQLWFTTMDPERRYLKKVNVEDAEEADRIFDILMGEEVAPRKRFIQANAREVENLDT